MKKIYKIASKIRVKLAEEPDNFETIPSPPPEGVYDEIDSIPPARMPSGLTKKKIAEPKYRITLDFEEKEYLTKVIANLPGSYGYDEEEDHKRLKTLLVKLKNAEEE